MTNTPQIRFKGFDEEWEEKKLGEVCEVTMGQSPDGETYSDKPSTYILVQGNADMQDGFVCPRVWTTQKTKEANKGDLIFSVRAPVGDIGKTNFDVVIGRGVAAIKGDEFIFQSLKKMNDFGYWKSISCGSTFESINSNNLANAILSFPSETEQQKIGEIFSQIDSLIASTQKEHDKLVTLKKCMLQKMFPKKGSLVPEIRFKGFTDEWVEMIFSEIGTVKSGYSFQSENFINQGIPVIRITNIQDGEVSFQDIVRHTKFEIDKDFIAERGDILLAMSGATTGKIGVYERDSISYINQRVGKFIFNDENTCKSFYKALFDTEFFMKQVIGSVAIGAQPNIGTRNVENMRFTLPTDKNEQQKIGAYFQNLDNLISKQAAELEKLKNVKKTLLSKMFV